MKFEDWGLIDYSESFQRQLEAVQKIAQGEMEERVVFCSHPPVVTLGRSSDETDVQGWSGEVVPINRGGRATYHGPSQIVIYPLLNLTQSRSEFASKDIGAYLRFLEAWVIRALGELGILAERKEAGAEDGDRSFTGVWVEDRKIASIGIAVKRWVSHHGCALNLRPDEKAFSGIQPCGFNRRVMTHVEAEAGRQVDYGEMKALLTRTYSVGR